MSEDITIAIEQNGVMYENEEFVNFKLGEKDKEIEELKEELKEANDSITWWSNRFKVVERDNIRLNNIINELEKWVKEDKECFETQFYMGRCVNFQCILDKLQELEGNDKE